MLEKISSKSYTSRRKCRPSPMEMKRLHNKQTKRKLENFPRTQKGVCEVPDVQRENDEGMKEI